MTPSPKFKYRKWRILALRSVPSLISGKKGWGGGGVGGGEGDLASFYSIQDNAALGADQ